MYPVRILSSVFYYSGLLTALDRIARRFRFGSDRVVPILSRSATRTFQILIYHRVHPGDRTFSLDALPPAVFERQVQHLARHCNVRPLEAIIDSIQKGDELPENCVAITLDDGYLDNYTYAYPILKRLGMPATIFLTTGCVGTDEVLWFDTILRAFQQTSRMCAKVDGLGEFPLGTPGQKRDAAHDVLGRLKTMEERERIRMVEQILDDLEVDPRGPRLMLDWDEVREMSNGGISFGAHTVHHPILTRMTRDRATEEIYEAKQAIERVLQKPARLFAYPNGQPSDFSEEIVSVVREAGYDAAVSTVFKTNVAGPELDLYQLGRLRPWEEHLATFALKLLYYRMKAA